MGAMFRYDRPQKGRFRLHHQFGAEILGSDAPAADVEVLSLPIRLMQSLGLTEATARINSIGDGVCRPRYVQALRDYFRPHASAVHRWGAASIITRARPRRSTRDGWGARRTRCWGAAATMGWPKRWADRMSRAGDSGRALSACALS